jgi:hypothetical protein
MALEQHLRKELADLYVRLLLAEHSPETSVEECLRKELSDLYVRVVVAEYSLEKLAKEKIQAELNKIQHQQSLRAMQNYHQCRQAALDYYKRKHEVANDVKPDECDCGRPDCTHLAVCYAAGEQQLGG